MKIKGKPGKVMKRFFEQIVCMRYRGCIHLIGKDMVGESISKIKLVRLQDNQILCQKW